MALMILSLSADCCTIACRAEHDRLGALVGVFQDHGETADALDQRGDVVLTKLLFEQHQIGFPLSVDLFHKSPVGQ